MHFRAVADTIDPALLEDILFPVCIRSVGGAQTTGGLLTER
jgi:hypothetical protein